MNNAVKTFRAATAEDAMDQVHRELGQDAVVIEVTNVGSRGLFAWAFSRPQVEVKASAAQAPKQQMAQLRLERASARFPSNKGTIAAAAAAAAANSKSAQSVRLAAPLAPSVDAASGHGLARVEPLRDVEPTANLSRHAAVKSAIQSLIDLQTPPATVSPSETTKLPVSSASGTEARPVPQPSFFPTGLATASAGMEPLSTIEQRLNDLQQMIADLGQRPKSTNLAQVPPELFPIYLKLIESDVDDEIAHDLIAKLQQHSGPAQLVETASSTAVLTVLMEERIACAGTLNPQPGQRQIAMVVGPTGVGKTTTLAKLAAGFSVERDMKVGLITVDTYRVAAVEQLRTYAQIIDLPMRVVSHVSQIQEALDSLADCDLVVIDTAGRSPNDDRQLNELKQLIEAACPDHIYLVLSLASGVRTLRSAAERFAFTQPTSLVITKLDEAVGCGGLLAVARDIGLPISYFTTGQEVPRDIEPANPCRAARLILGTDRITRH